MQVAFPLRLTILQMKSALSNVINLRKQHNNMYRKMLDQSQFTIDFKHQRPTLMTLLPSSRNSSDRALNRYANAHKTRKECILAPACLAKSHRDAILTPREGLSELLPYRILLYGFTYRYHEMKQLLHPAFLSRVQQLQTTDYLFRTLMPCLLPKQHIITADRQCPR